MIKKIVLHNLKLHDQTEVAVRGLTVLTGMNGMGKSSVIQALLLLRQSFLMSDLESGINLKGDLCDVGTSGELGCQSSAEHTLKISLEMEGQEDLHFVFEYPDNLYDTFLPGKDNNITGKDILEKYSLFNTHFQYLGAFRFGPRRSYERDTSIVNTRKQISRQLGQCEYVVHFLEQYRFMPIPIPELAIVEKDEDVDYTLKGQVEKWLRRLSPNINIYIEPSQEDFRLKYKFNREGAVMTEDISALNTGFGITYVLPILVSILSAGRDALIIIENPEAHLHPRGQAILMELITLAVSHGVQVIVETHSDHIINGGLVALKKGVFSKEMLSAYYFERDETKHTALAHQLEISETGKIRRPPKGFFDQIDIDLRTLTGF